MNAPPEEADEMSKTSKRECRVYVGNLSYDVKYRDLMEFMRGGGSREGCFLLYPPTEECGMEVGCTCACAAGRAGARVRGGRFSLFLPHSAFSVERRMSTLR